MAGTAGRIIFALGIAAAVAAIPVSAAQAAWGCAATNGTATGRSWGFPNHAAASYRALAECAQRTSRGGCRIVGCRAAIDSSFDARAAWLDAASLRPPASRPGAHVARAPVHATATTASGDRCGSPQARCAIAVGAHCNPRTGFWCVGPGQLGNNYCGGNNAAWLACLDRVRAGQR